ncbi:acyltransferase domain-containing protein [Bacillus mycoides]|uniref:type I polyketide synthase n=1 Tax=Bacillus mycoides TaxID=1405 RepID=UPI00187A93D9|nr:type I polyketide synthase [Bacillus mycoides]MBE7150061.1 acyltransferase domain-containing protein [Bacillus mycoides]
MNQSDSLDGIAIIGMTGRFPGAKNPEELWENIRDGIESISIFTEEQLEEAGVDPALIKKANYVSARGILEEIEMFDASFFGVNPREAEIIDPQHRIFMECAWEVLERSGYIPDTYEGTIGVFAGTGYNHYAVSNLNSNDSVIRNVGAFQIMLGNEKDHLSTRTSYKLNLTGPSYNIQTACSTSLVAVSIACQNLLTYQCDIALAGGVSITSPQESGYIYETGGILSPDGRCRPFDAESKGTVSGNGLGIIALKRLEDALQDGDEIHAVIKGVATNNDGSLKVGYTAPSVEGQAKVISQAQALADIEAETITYIEAHGTGTELGDPIEVAALNQAFRMGTDKENYCALGSVKGNIGHLDTAAGITGLIKTTMALKNKQIPPTLHFKEPNPKIDFVNSPFYVNTTLKEWEVKGIPRRAGVSSFGVGGTNAHVVLEEAPTLGPSGPSRDNQLLVLSAKTPTALEKATENLASYLEKHPEKNLADIAYTLQVGRKKFNHRRILVCDNSTDGMGALKTLDPKQVLTTKGTDQHMSVGFMFPGQGSQYINMAADLYRQESLVRDEIDRCAEILLPYLGLDVRNVLFPLVEQTKEATEQLKQTWLSQPAIFVVEYALARLWMSWGIQPKAMIGHSIGEYVAACLAGVFSLEDALKLVAVRGRLMQSAQQGSMLAVMLSENELMSILPEKLSLAAVNTSKICVVAGPTEVVKQFEKLLEERKVGCRHLHTSHAFHSTMMEPILDAFIREVEQIKLMTPTIPYISNVTGTWITEEEAVDPNYWGCHLRQTVRFAEGVKELLAIPNCTLIEIGPGRTLGTFVRQQLSNTSEQTILSSLRHPQDQISDTAFLMRELGKAWMTGVEVDWKKFWEGEHRYRVTLPTYPFERKRYWVEPNHIDVNSDSERGIITEREGENYLFEHPSSISNNQVPTNEIEECVQGIWIDLLGVNRIGVHDDFFSLGGHSLLGTKLISRLREIFQIEISMRVLFDAPTISQMALVIEEILLAELEGLEDEELTNPIK